MLDSLWALPVYALPQQEKQQHLLAQLNLLSQHHQQHCADYRNLLNNLNYSTHAETYADLLPLAVRHFKLGKLSSVPVDEEFKVMTSSGTTSQVVSQVVLDRETAMLQSKALVYIFKDWIGSKRLPMLIIDHQGLTKNRSGYSARGAGVQGLSFLGRAHCYALDENMQIRWPEVEAFIDQYGDGPVLIFGFTFMLWQHFLTLLQAQQRCLQLNHGVLFHSGGWKKLQDQAVDNPTFKALVKRTIGNLKVHNFYGMVEQTGTVYIECEQGHLHAPLLADILIRNQHTLQPAEMGETGLIQVLSALPYSYPGHSLLTEDLGRVLGEDDCSCGRKGRYFEVLGRLPKTEVRGCSDTFQ